MNEQYRLMLTNAAKAANIPVQGWTIKPEMGMRLVDDDYNFVDFWAPHLDDAQCLQLARKLGINIEYSQQCTAVCGAIEFWGDDLAIKTDREAVVAVAAQLGEKL